jgi:WhiB family redox-sensing transcriptional regulator
MTLTLHTWPLWPLLDQRNDRAECRFDPDLHTGPDAFEEESLDERAVREDVAKEVCGGCPVRMACLEHALKTLPEYGIWAGFTADEIAELAADLHASTELGDVA